MTTARTLITSALRTNGVLADGQALQAEDGQNCLVRLNDLLDSWAVDSLYAQATVEYRGTVSGASATIGPGANIVTPVIPTRLESAFVRSGGVDYPVELVTYQEFSAIPFKGITGPWPSMGYYDGDGVLQLYPGANNAELHIGVLARLSEFDTLDHDFTFRPGVRRALTLSLAEEIGPEYSVQVNPVAMKLASAARRSLRRSNHVTPALSTSVYYNSSSGSMVVGGAGGGGTTDGGTVYDGVDGGTP